MAGQYAVLKDAIEAVIKTNGNREITGALMQQSLLAMIASLGAHYQFVDVATPSTNPGTPDQNVMYFAGTAGTYTNFGGIVVNEGEFCALCWNGEWIKKTTGAATAEQVVDIINKLNPFLQVFKLNDLSKLFVTDGYGNVIAKIDSSGVHSVNFIVPSGELQSMADAIKVDNKDAFYIVDAWGNIMMKVDKDGLNIAKLNASLVELIAESIYAPIGQAIEKIDNMGADFNMVICYGQSLSMTAAASAVSINYPLNLFAFENFAEDMRISYTDVDAGAAAIQAKYGNSFVPVTHTGWTGQLKPMMWAINNMMSRDNGIDAVSQKFNMIGIAPGISGATLQNLSPHPPTAEYIYGYERMMQAVENGKRIALSMGKTFEVPFLFWVQGESNFNNDRVWDESTQTWGSSVQTTKETYKQNMVLLFGWINNAIKAITGQTNDVKFIVYQPATFATTAGLGGNQTPNDAVAMAMLDIATDENCPNVFWGGAMYQYAYCQTDLHPTKSATQPGYGSIPYEYMGAIAGIQAKRICFGGSPIRPILPIRHTIVNAGTKYILDVEFDTESALVLDVSAEVFHNPYSAGLSNYGFEILSNNVDIIESVSVNRFNHVTFVCGSNPSGLVLTYAKNGIGFTESQGAGKDLSSPNILYRTGGGCLRDSQGDSIKVNVGGVDMGIYNFAPIFKYNL